MNTTIWIIQGLLAAFFIIPAFMKLASSKEKLIEKGQLEPNTSPLPVRAIGVLELLGIIGIIVPYYTGILPVLTSWAAIGFSLVMAGAFMVHFKKKEFKMLPLLSIIFILSVTVAYSRFRDIQRQASTETINNQASNKNNSMKQAEELLHEYLNNIDNPEKVASLFTEDGAIELPYLASLDRSWRTVGPDNIKSMISGLLKIAPDFGFKNIKVHITTPGQVFGEYEVETLMNGLPYKQLYMGRLVAENGKIKLLRESMDMVAVQKVFSTQ